MSIETSLRAGSPQESSARKSGGFNKCGAGFDPYFEDDYLCKAISRRAVSERNPEDLGQCELIRERS
jgi:hypothetical protein